jgi:PTS system nitrogen regulatory IIA component
MKISDIISLDCTLCAVQTSSKKRMLELICEQAAKKFDQLNTYTLLDSLLIREKMGSTGIGNGIAIPHGRLAINAGVVAVIATSKDPVNFDAIDNRPVDIFIALFVPEENCQAHLHTLQSIAALFSDKVFCKQVRKCQTSLELYQLVKRAS